MPEQSTPHRSETPFSQVPVDVVVSVGRARPKISELLQLEKHAVLLLDRRVEDPVELYVGEKLIARGELIEQNDGPNRYLAVRLTEIAAPGSGLVP